MPISQSHAENLMQMLEAAEDCLRARRHIPALVLLYSLVDSLAWAGANRSNPDLRTRFEHWVSRWLMPHLPPASPRITATDLYAARCAILHTGTGVSDLSKSGKAKRLMYAWGNAKTEVLEYAIAHSRIGGEHAALHYDALLVAVRLGAADFFASATSDPELASRIEEVASFQYTNVPSDPGAA